MALYQVITLGTAEGTCDMYTLFIRYDAQSYQHEPYSPKCPQPVIPGCAPEVVVVVGHLSLKVR